MLTKILGALLLAYLVCAQTTLLSISPCPFVDCPIGQVQNPTSCKCVRSIICTALCPGNQIRVDCKCVCPDLLGGLCPSGQKYDENTCKCASVFGCSNTCPDYQTQDALCKCGCAPLNCYKGMSMDYKQCICVNTKKCTKKCPLGQSNDASCNCICIPKSCPKGQLFDTVNCSCQPYYIPSPVPLPCSMLCAQGKKQVELNGGGCTCVCKNPLKCPAGQIYNQDLCKCVPQTKTLCNNSCAPEH